MNLSVTRKADRIKMADRLMSAARLAGAATTRDERRREICVTIQIGEAKVRVSLDGESRVGGFLGHWVSPVGFPHSFGYPGGPADSVNPYHGHKATTYADDLSRLCERIAAGIKSLAKHQGIA